MFIEVHAIQNFAPANLNRDDTGNPKDCEFGGVRRARVSSQCLKRAIREHPVFQQTTDVEKGTRTRWLARAVSERLEESGKPKESADKVAIAFATEFLGDMDKKEPQRSNVLAYLDADEIQMIVDGLLEDWEAAEAGNATPNIIKKLAKNLGIFTSAPDVALFGRMLARKPTTLKLDAACQVAHAISTHRVTMEMDFYTAIDDLKKDEETGAAMMGFTAYDSACFYRYARLDWQQLVDNLDGDAALARRAVEGFLRASVSAIPTGKQNSFAAQNPPGFLLAVVKPQGMAWSLANAFEVPVHSGNNGLTIPSVEKLDAYWGRLVAVYGLEAGATVTALALDDGLPLQTLQNYRVATLEEWVEATVEALPAGEA